MSTVLVLGNFRQTLTVFKSLVRKDFEVISGRDAPRVFTEYSRYPVEVWDHPKFTEQTTFISALCHFLSARPDISLVFPVGEAPLEAISLNYESVAGLVPIAMPDPKTVLTCLNKQETYDIISRLNIPLPVSRSVYNISELISSATDIGFPCVVKPNDSLGFFFKQKAIICRSHQDIERTFGTWPRGNNVLILQRYVGGNRSNCHFAAKNGLMVSYFEQMVIRTDRVDGTGYGVDGVSMAPSPELRTYCTRLITHLNYSGVGCIQFLRDKDSGKACFLEINPRLDATCAIPYYCGVDFPGTAVDIALTQHQPAPAIHATATEYPVGKRGYWLNGDIQGLLRGLKDGSIGLRGAVRWTASMLQSLSHADFHLTFSWEDPIPALFLGIKPIFSVWHKSHSPVHAQN